MFLWMREMWDLCRICNEKCRLLKDSVVYELEFYTEDACHTFASENKEKS